MKKIILFTFLFIIGIGNNVNSQFLDNESAKKLVKTKIVVGLTDNPKTNEWLIEAVENAWYISESFETLPLEEALQKLNDEGNITVIQLGTDVSQRTSVANGFETTNKSSGLYIGLNTHGGKQANLIQHIIYNTKAQFIFGLSGLQDAVNTIIDDNLSGMMKVRKAYNLRKGEVKGKTLIICEKFVGEGISSSDIKAAYGGNVEILSFENFENAIIEKAENAAYLNFVVVPVGDTFRVVGYVLDCENRKTYDIFVNGTSFYVNKKTLKTISKNFK